MVQINFAQKQVNAKIVYYGPGMSGKTTNLEVIHQRAPENNRGDLTSISTEGDRTLFFDFMPLDLGTVAGMRTCFQIYTVPGQVYYNSTRKLVLQGVDGVIFVADSSPNMMEENLESLRNLAENLEEYGRSIDEMPLVIQYNKRDIPGALPIEELEEKLNAVGAPAFEAIANTGQGVFPTLKAVAACVLDSLHKQQGANSSAPPPPPNSGAPVPSAPLPGAGGPQATASANAQATPSAPSPQPAAPSPAQPVAQSSGTGRPTMSMSQTGFHKAPSVPLGQSPAPAATQASAAGSRTGGRQGTPEPTPAPQEGGGLQMRSPAGAPAPQPVANAAPQRPAARTVAPPQAAAPQAAPAPAAAPSSVMGAGEAPSAAPQRRIPTSRSFPNTPSSGKARPTPRKKKGKSALVTGIIVVASVGIGAVLGSVLLSFL